MPAMLYIQYWEDCIGDLLIQNYKYGQLVQVFPRKYKERDRPILSTDGGQPVLILPNRILDKDQAMQYLNNVLEWTESEENTDTKSEGVKLQQITSFLVTYFGKLDLFDLDIPVKWQNYLRSSFKVDEQLDWRRLLQDFTAQFGKRSFVPSNRKFSKRYYTTPGRSWKPQAKLAFLLDVSASMKESSLAMFLNEMDHLLDKGIELILFQVDDRIRSIEPYRRGMPIKIGRGGGTNFNSAFDYIEEENQFDGLIICTDGLLQIRPRALKINHIWVLDSQTELPFELSGIQAYLNH